jgi:hypothetical protein
VVEEPIPVMLSRGKEEEEKEERIRKMLEDMDQIQREN